MKVYLHYEEGKDADVHTTIKIKLPGKWRTGPVSNLKKCFVDAFNKKHPDSELDLAQVHIETADHVALAEEDVVDQHFENKGDVYIRHGAPKTELTPATIKAETAAAPATATASAAAAPATATATGLLKCKNYGCNQEFSEAKNEDGACQHHTGPPIFHEGRKGWSCCKDRSGGLAYDWDGFMAIKGCAFGKHSTVAPAQTFAASPTVELAEAAASNVHMKSIDDFDKENPDAPAAHKTAVAATAPVPRRADGKAKCLNGGCQKEYVVADNHARACQYHSGKPIFHDARKSWSCCPDSVAYDWDGFMQIVGCQVGPHTDGNDDTPATAAAAAPAPAT